MRTLLRGIGLLLLVAGLAAGPGVCLAQDPVPEEAGEEQPNPADYRWPRVIEGDGITFSVYQPQIDRFDANGFEARAAVQVETPEDGKTRTSYGVIWIQARPFIDKEAGLVELDDIQITKANFPTAGEKADRYLEILRSNAQPTRTVSLERIEANLAVTQADKKGEPVPLKNDPPRIYYRNSPALLLLIDGEPVLRPVEGSEVRRVVNSRSLILEDGGVYFIPIADRWLQGKSATGPWQLAAGVSPAVQAVRDAIGKDENQTRVDLLVDPGEDVQALLGRGSAPELIVSTIPAELLLTSGKPQMKPISGTQLLYVSNTTGDILFDLDDQRYYVPLTGRWFRSKSLEGPWQFVDGAALPKDFAKIPTNDPKASVLATVPGTPAAQEAVIANGIPQTAEVNREEAKFEPQYDGDPRFEDVPETPLEYAANSPYPVIRVSDTSYFAVQGGVWFTAESPLGPWIVATEVPSVIYTIPTGSPIHYATYVHVYRYNPTSVWVGYTPGYMGTCYSPWGTVVFGTGWYYPPWIGSMWFGAPWTWGFGVGISWSPWTGWDVGFGWGGYWPMYGPWWGPYYGWRPHHRPPYYGRPPHHGGPYPGRPRYPGRPAPGGPPPGTHINNLNVYNRPGVTRPGVRPAPRPVPAASVPPGATRPQPGTRPAAPTTGRPAARPAPSRPDNLYAGPDGKVYRPRTSGGWETNESGTWRPVQPAPAPARPETRPAPQARPAPQPSRPTVDRNTLNQLSRERQGRQSGNMRMSPPPSRPAPAPRAPAPRAPAPRPPSRH